MNDIDLELKLLKGKRCNVYLNNILIKPLTLDEMVDVGFIKFIKSLQLYVLDIPDLIEGVSPGEYSQLKIFDLLFYVKDFSDKYIPTLKTLLKTDDIQLDYRNNRINVNSQYSSIAYIDRNNWDEFCKLISLMYCLKKPVKEEDEYHPANAQAEAFIKHLKELKAQDVKPKENINILSIVSGIAWKSPSINILNIWDLTIYQLYDALPRLDIIDKFNHTLNGYYAGTIDKKSIDFKKLHWTNISNT